MDNVAHKATLCKKAFTALKQNLAKKKELTVKK